MTKKNKKTTSAANGQLAYSSCNYAEKAKQNLIDFIEEFEAFGMYNAYCLKKECPCMLSTKIGEPKVIKEFGKGLISVEFCDLFLDMLDRLFFEGLRIRILKTAGFFLNESYLIRQYSQDNVYPEWYHTEKVKILGGDQEIEIVFFAESELAAERIKKRIHGVMEKGRTFQNAVDEAFETDSGDFLELLLDDPKIQIIMNMHFTMTDAFVKKALQEKKGTKND